MDHRIKTEERQGTGEAELRRLIEWSMENPDDWDCLCDPESYERGGDYYAALIGRLCQEGLLSIAYLTVWRNCYLPNIDRAIFWTGSRLLLDTPTGEVVEAFQRHLAQARPLCPAKQ